MALDEKSRAYLKLLVERSEGDSNRQVSMFDFGELLGSSEVYKRSAWKSHPLVRQV